MEKPMPTLTPFLWFDTQAEDAMRFYVSLFKDSVIGDINRAGPDGPVMSVSFELNGQKFYALNGGPHFKFNEAISIFVDCDTQAEVDDLWAKLTADGGQESMCGWLKDKYGLSWQIIPKLLGQLLSDPNPAKAKAAMDAMLTMRKIESAELQRAYDQA
jgi:predicted 3-demethylubiquinone-9 3-methyltransferase (glyoxalase superfamily)